MKNLTTKRGLRCAIYTRVSTDQGLEQDFNSLDAQREASEAYIKSDALTQWGRDQPAHAVIEITDSGLYVEREPINISLRNCPALSSGLCESEAGDQLDGGGHQGLDEVPALFSGG